MDVETVKTYLVTNVWRFRHIFLENTSHTDTPKTLVTWTGVRALTRATHGNTVYTLVQTNHSSHSHSIH